MSLYVRGDLAILKETPLVDSPNYYGITKQDVDELKGKATLNFILRYQSTLIRKMDTIPSSELEDLILFNVEMVNDKLTWLRDLNTVINVNRTSSERVLIGNAKVLDTLIPKIIDDYKTRHDLKLNSNSFSVEKIDTKFTTEEFALLFNLMFKCDLIEYKQKKKAISRTIAKAFNFIKGKEINPDSIYNNYLPDNIEAFNSLSDKLDDLVITLKHLNESQYK